MNKYKDDNIHQEVRRDGLPCKDWSIKWKTI